MAQAEAPPHASSSLKKDRSPSFPFITLTKSIERARELYMAARRHEMRLPDAATAMKYGPKSSGAIQTMAALIAFGLVEDSGSGEARKFKITDLAFKALEDQRPGARESALAKAALTPKLIAEYADRWKDGRPADGICLSELRVEGGFTEDGAKLFLRVFDDALTYVKTDDADKKGSTNLEGGQTEPPDQQVAVGDLVRVEAGGQIVYEKTRVRQIDGQWVFVEASTSAAKLSDVTLLEKAPAGNVAPPTLPFTQTQEKTQQGERTDLFTVDEGVVKITFPAEMTAESVEELKEFFDLFIRKAKRRAGVSTTSDIEKSS